MTIAGHLQNCVDSGVFPGAVYLYGTSKEVLGHGCAGNLAVDRGPVDEGSLYDLASLTKPIVALALMRQLEEGLVCLDDAIDYYLPAYKAVSKGKNTIFQLLTHTSEIPGQVQLYRTCHTREEMLDGILYLPPRDNKSVPVNYSSQGMIVIGEIIAAIGGKPLDQVMEELVFAPLGMRDTMFNPPQALSGRIPSTENCPWRGKTVTGQVHDENAVVLGGVCGHAGLFSTAADVAKVGRAMLTGSCGGGSRFLRRATISLMTANHTEGLNLARGLGWQCRDAHDSPAGDLFSRSSYGHTGFTGTSLWIDPERDLYAVLLTNRVNPTRSGEGIVRARHIYHNLVCCAWEDAAGRNDSSINGKER